MRCFLQFNGLPALSAWDQKVLGVEKVRSACNSIRNDPDLTRLLASVARKAEEDAAAVSEFAQRARDYA